MRVTLGGDRLGAGKRQKVETSHYERSTHDLGFVWRSTMSFGTLVPFLSTVGLPGDSWDIDLNLDVKTHPTVGPLFGSAKCQLDIFMTPIRLYIRELHNNKLGIGMNMDQVKLPYIQLTAPTTQADDSEITDRDNLQINPSSLLAYLGIRGVGSNAGVDPQNRNFNGLPVLAYYDIVKNYYSNKQEEFGYIIHNEVNQADNQVDTMGRLRGPVIIPEFPASVIADFTVGDVMDILFVNPTWNFDTLLIVDEFGNEVSLTEWSSSILNTGPNAFTALYNHQRWGNRAWVSWRNSSTNATGKVAIQLKEYQISSIDEIRETILGATIGVPYNITTFPEPPFSWLNSGEGLVFARQYSQEGLAVKTYQSDLFNNWLNTEWIDGVNGISEVTKIDTTDGLYIDSLILQRKVFDMLNNIAVSGGTYQDWIHVQYDDNGKWNAEIPVYMGGLSQELVFQEVVSTNTTPGEPLGTLAGKGRMSDNRKGGHVNIKCDEICYITGIVSVTPRIDYSQGNKWDIHLQTMNDFHVPALDQIGFQELITEQMAWWSTFHNGLGQWIQKSAGKQPAWMNYMTDYNRTYGNFAIKGDEMFMTFNRQYEPDPTGDMTEGIIDLTTYIDPAKYNNIFADSSLDSQNLWVQIGINATARRKMSYKIMPNL